jgi:hypothetical protein
MNFPSESLKEGSIALTCVVVDENGERFSVQSLNKLFAPKQSTTYHQSFGQAIMNTLPSLLELQFPYNSVLALSLQSTMHAKMCGPRVSMKNAIPSLPPIKEEVEV